MMLLSRHVDERAIFGDLRVVVIDEVHALAGTDRSAHLMSAVERLARCGSATFSAFALRAPIGNPDVILDWLRGTSR